METAYLPACKGLGSRSSSRPVSTAASRSRIAGLPSPLPAISSSAVSFGSRCIYIRVYTYVYTYIHTYMHIYIRVKLCVCVCVVCVYVNLYIYIHTHLRRQMRERGLSSRAQQGRASCHSAPQVSAFLIFYFFLKKIYTCKGSTLPTCCCLCRLLRCCARLLLVELERRVFHGAQS